MKLITPSLAKDLLKKNGINRALDKHLIAEYAREMRNGLWYEYTYESIKLAEDGTLMDGQHRLTALIDANVSLTFKIDYGLDKIAFKYLDSGKRRTAGDKFHCAGILNSRNMAAGIRRYLILKEGHIIGNFKGGGSKKISDAELLSIYESSPKLYTAAHQMGEQWYNKSGRLLRVTEFMAFHLYFREINEDDAYTFMSKFGEGINLTEGDPIKLLRERLTTAKMNPTMNLSGYAKTGLIIKAWNHFRKNDSIKMLRFSPALDTFPIPV